MGDVGKGPLDGGGATEIGHRDGGVVYVPTGLRVAWAEDPDRADDEHTLDCFFRIPHVAQEFHVVSDCCVVNKAWIKGLQWIYVSCSKLQWMGRALGCFNGYVIAKYVGVVSYVRTHAINIYIYGIN